MKRPMIVGITGGIGSGKSYVCQLLKAQGIPVYSCDTEAKRLMVDNADIVAQLRELLGEEAYVGDGTLSLNKPLIANYLFASPDHAARINAIVHPHVRHDMEAWAARQQCDIVLVESAILVEAGLLDAVDFVIMVDAPQELRLERVMQRDAAHSNQVLARMRRQMQAGELRQYADFVILNDGEADLQAQIADCRAAIQKKKETINQYPSSLC